MTKPLALVCYENLLPGSQLLNKLPDLGYRVAAVTDASKLVAEARATHPLVILADLQWKQLDFCAIIRQLKEDTETQHIPVVVYTRADDKKGPAAAVKAGATLVAGEAGLLAQLPQLLEQALVIE
ncbi:MAG TPA: response regulator [Verrucomicrobiae bacterium]|nr:response regulator [Verrucomicrobiae bacterium]